jgi:xylulose-5-phosphate/fructose-6-phosphate phosphoketolase
MSERAFVELFTRETDVVFAFHGYQRAIHEILHGRPRADRFHVRGFNEEGTTTTPFDMVVLNGISRYHLCIEALRRAPRMAGRAAPLIERCTQMLTRHEVYVREHLQDLPEVRDWAWTDA